MLNRNFCIPILSDGVVTISAVVAAFRFNKSPSEFIQKFAPNAVASLPMLH